MLKRNGIVLTLIIILCLGGCATTREEYLALDKEHFKRTLTLKDDSLDTVAIFSTVNGFKHRDGIIAIKTFWGDNFIRAFVHKKTGVTTFQVYNSIYYGGSGWQFYNRVNYETPDGPKSKNITVIDRNVDCQGSGGCTHNEHVAFTVEQSLLDILTNKYKSNPAFGAGWKYKIIAKAGGDYNSGLLQAEIAALVEVVAEYKKARGL